MAILSQDVTPVSTWDGFFFEGLGQKQTYVVVIFHTARGDVKNSSLALPWAAPTTMRCCCPCATACVRVQLLCGVVVRVQAGRPSPLAIRPPVISGKIQAKTLEGNQASRDK